MQHEYEWLWTAAYNYAIRKDRTVNEAVEFAGSYVNYVTSHTALAKLYDSLFEEADTKRDYQRGSFSVWTPEGKGRVVRTTDASRQHLVRLEKTGALAWFPVERCSEKPPIRIEYQHTPTIHMQCKCDGCRGNNGLWGLF